MWARPGPQLWCVQAWWSPLAGASAEAWPVGRQLDDVGAVEGMAGAVWRRDKHRVAVEGDARHLHLVEARLGVGVAEVSLPARTSVKVAPPSRVHVAHIPSRAPGDDEFLVKDIESFVDRLRFMGVDQRVVDEAHRRLRADPRRGSRWVAERLRELEPPRRAPTCDCGEVLVGTEWRGRATVRCSECGARWGIEVIDGETESLWSIGTPTS